VKRTIRASVPEEDTCESNTAQVGELVAQLGEDGPPVSPTLGSEVEVAKIEAT